MTDHFTESEAQDVLAYVSYLLEVTSLGNNFQVVLMHQTAEDWMEDDDADVNAGINVLDTKYAAQLYLSKNWGEYSNGTKTDTLIHELLHVHHRRVDLVLDDLTEQPYVPVPDARIFRDQYKREQELLVDRMASILQPLLLEYPVEAEIAPRVVIEGNHF